MTLEPLRRPLRRVIRELFEILSEDLSEEERALALWGLNSRMKDKTDENLGKRLHAAYSVLKDWAESNGR